MPMGTTTPTDELEARAEALHERWQSRFAAHELSAEDVVDAHRFVHEAEDLLADVMSLSRSDEAARLVRLVHDRRRAYGDAFEAASALHVRVATGPAARARFDAERAMAEYARHFENQPRRSRDLVRLRSIEARLRRSVADASLTSRDGASPRDAELARHLEVVTREHDEVVRAQAALTPVQRARALQERGDALIAQYVTHFSYQGFATGSPERYDRVLEALRGVVEEMRAPSPAPVPQHRVRCFADNLLQFEDYRPMADLGGKLSVEAKLSALEAIAAGVVSEHATRVEGRAPTAALRDVLTSFCDRMADIAEQIWSCVERDPTSRTYAALTTTLALVERLERAWTTMDQRQPGNRSASTATRPRRGRP